MTLLPGDIVLIHRGTGWMVFAPLVWLWQWAVGPYHVEMVWDVIPDPFPTTTSTLGPEIIGYKAFSLQPPVLGIVERRFADLKISAYRLKNRSDLMTDIFWRWGNKWLTTPRPYVLGWQTCGHPIEAFYKELGIEIGSVYPGGIEKFCKGSDKFVEVR